MYIDLYAPLPAGAWTTLCTLYSIRHCCFNTAILLVIIKLNNIITNSNHRIFCQTYRLLQTIQRLHFLLASYSTPNGEQPESLFVSGNIFIVLSAPRLSLMIISWHIHQKFWHSLPVSPSSINLNNNVRMFVTPVIQLNSYSLEV